MLAIGRALMAKPKILLLDEPSTGLAPIIVKNIFRILKDLSENTGLSILLVEQNARLALEYSKRGYVLETGMIVSEGDAADLLQDKNIIRAYLGKDYREVTDR
jgi:branched-chain amino acid transport system ATP-binding protein